MAWPRPVPQSLKTGLVSIITPSYNQAAYLEQTLRSVLEQGYAPLEYIVVDAGSTDGSVAIIQKYAHRLAWWVSERDSGQAEAINKGLQRASGEIVAWLNSDDLYLPGAVSQAVVALESNAGLDFVFGDAITIDAAGRTISLEVGPSLLEERRRQWQPPARTAPPGVLTKYASLVSSASRGAVTTERT